MRFVRVCLLAGALVASGCMSVPRDRGAGEVNRLLQSHGTPLAQWPQATGSRVAPSALPGKVLSLQQSMELAFSRSPVIREQFAELGLTGICIPESAGGAGMGATEAGLVLEEIGRNLTPSPFLTTAVAAVRALEGSAQAERWFPGILGGETVAALAIDEGKHHNPGSIALESKRSGNGFALNGAKQFVVHGKSADVILVAARTGRSGRYSAAQFTSPRASSRPSPRPSAANSSR